MFAPILGSCATLTSLLGTKSAAGAVAASFDPVRVACGSFQPIRLARAEWEILTEESVLQIKEHNAVWSRLCVKEGTK